MFSSSVLNAKHFIQSGDFKFLTFGYKTSIIFADSTFIQHLEPKQQSPKVSGFNVGGMINAMQISPDYFYLTVCIETTNDSKTVNDSDNDNNDANMNSKQNGAASNATRMIMIFDCETFQTIGNYGIDMMASVSQMRISSTNECIWLIAEDDSNKLMQMKCLTLFDGKLLADTKLDINELVSIGNRNALSASDFWYQFSLCPADDSITCLVCKNRAILMRACGGTIERLLEDSSLPVTSIYATAEKFVCIIADLLVFIFDIKNGECHWDMAISVVISTTTQQPSCCIEAFCLDSSGENFIYSDGAAIWYGSLRYPDIVCGRGAQVLLMKHSQPIRSLHISQEHKRIASLDSSGLIIVSSTQSKMLIAYGIFEGAISVTFLSSGHSLLIVFANEILIFHIVYHSLRRARSFIKGCRIGKIAVNSFAKQQQAAICVDDVLMIYSLNNLELLTKLPFHFKQTIHSLKWSTNGDYLGVLTQNDCVSLINVSTKMVVWHLQMKMRFFVDISVEDAHPTAATSNAAAIVYALNKKFIITKFLNAKEIEQVSGHSAQISFSGGQSTSLVTAEKGHFIGSSTGHIVYLPYDVLENIRLLHTHISSEITVLCASIDDCSLLYIGCADGHLAFIQSDKFSTTRSDNAHNNSNYADRIVMDIISEKNQQKKMLHRDAKNINDKNDHSKNDNVSDHDGVHENEHEHNDDLVLYPLNEITKLKTLVKELDTERNFIRHETERIICEYKQRKDTELSNLATQNQQSNALMHEKVERIEEKLENVQALSGVTMENLRKLYEDEIRCQKQNFEKRFEEHLQRSCEAEESFENALRERDSRFSGERKRLISSFNVTETNLRKQIQAHQKTIDQAKRDNEENIKNQNLVRLKTIQEHCNELESRIVDEQNVSAKVFDVLRDRGRHKSDWVIRDHVRKLEENEICYREKLAQLKNRLAATQKQLQNEKAENKLTRRKLNEIYTKIEELSKNVYNLKELERHALGLIAFVKCD
ncbi:unnamed protein product [Anisakis simplex]|uniref:RIC1 domain-containing protein n=1 Tax=Anisakis simplex TaxID=6269 RepID=A0A0M3JTQ1_ANISI|nr:unnamed protein product [Anisakis simplex]